MQADVDGLIRAGRDEPGDDRQAWRNGDRHRSLDTRRGTHNLKIAKNAVGSLSPRLPGAENDGGEGAVAIIQEARINGVSARKGEELVQARGRPAFPNPPFPSCERT